MARKPERDRVEYFSRYALRDRVVIDGDKSIVGHVIAVIWEADKGCSIKVGWVHNGTAQEAWFHEWRLSEPPT